MPPGKPREISPRAGRSTPGGNHGTPQGRRRSPQPDSAGLGRKPGQHRGSHPPGPHGGRADTLPARAVHLRVWLRGRLPWGIGCRAFPGIPAGDPPGNPGHRRGRGPAPHSLGTPVQLRGAPGGRAIGGILRQTNPGRFRGVLRAPLVQSMACGAQRVASLGRRERTHREPGVRPGRGAALLRDLRRSLGAAGRPGRQNGSPGGAGGSAAQSQRQPLCLRKIRNGAGHRPGRITAEPRGLSLQQSGGKRVRAADLRRDHPHCFERKCRGGRTAIFLSPGAVDHRCGGPAGQSPGKKAADLPGSLRCG